MFEMRFSLDEVSSFIQIFISSGILAGKKTL